MSGSNDEELDANDDNNAENEIIIIEPTNSQESLYLECQKEDEAENDAEEKEVIKEEEEDEDYRLRVYGTADHDGEPKRRRKSQNSLQAFSKRVSCQLAQRKSSIVEALPKTPAGWTILLSALLSAGLGYELQLQKSLTQPPATFGQLAKGTSMSSIYQKLTATADDILSRPIQPSLFVGTRGQISSAAAFWLGGPSASTKDHLLFREIVTSSQDGAQVGVDWEVPRQTSSTKLSEEECQARILRGPIRQPVVIILHGINNDTSFGYMKSLSQTFANRGWNAAAMNFRGCGGVPMTTPRGYNASYTGDLRNLVHQISGRLADCVPLFLVGNSLGANLVAKYLGEEGLSGTLPACVAGGVSLGNPMLFNSEHIAFPYNVLIGLARKEKYMEHWRTMNKMKDPTFRKAVRKGLWSSTLAGLDRAAASMMVRNNSFYPFSPRVGYKDAESYWVDSGSYRLTRFISVPFLHLTAEDDFLAHGSSKNKLGFCVSNPNIMIVETRCGGHLGWQESPPDSSSMLSSWADVASADFFDSVIQVNKERTGSASGTNLKPDAETGSIDMGGPGLENMKEEAVAAATRLRSRL